ncbi:hypothetical protein [Streptomyces sp. 3N207]|uniref:hypothetical protein n=1 Tax=Streptomyces sp. 3N207 TaxID=3457417 RepID=UPI003FD16FE9
MRAVPVCAPNPSSAPAGTAITAEQENGGHRSSDRLRTAGRGVAATTGGRPLRRRLARWLGPQRDRTRARLEIILLTGRHPQGELGTELLRVRESFVSQAQLLAATLGSPDPQQDGRIVVAFAEGLTYDGVTRPGPDTTDRAALRQMLERVLLTLPGSGALKGSAGRQ